MAEREQFKRSVRRLNYDNSAAQYFNKTSNKSHETFNHHRSAGIEV